MTRFEATTYAKLNLSLAITGKRGGLHTLDSIMYPYEKYADKVLFFPQDGKIGFDVEASGGFDDFDEKRFCAFAQPKFDMIAKRYNVGGKLEIFKGVPLGAGLGGSSAAIASVVKAVLNYCESKGENTALDSEFLLSLGSDVPYMVRGGACRVRGVGEDVESLPYEGRIEVDEIIAKGGSDSGACYQLFDRTHGDNFDCQNVPETVSEAIERLRNDLFQSACKINPLIKAAYNELKKRGFDKVMMSGSGSAVFAIKGFAK